MSREESFLKKSELPNPLIYLLDDDPGTLRALWRLFKRDFEVRRFSGVEGVLKALEEEVPQAVVTEYELAVGDVLGFLKELREKHPYTAVVVVTASADIESASELLQTGLVDRFFTKPWDDDALLQAVKAAIREKSLARRNAELVEELERLVDLRTKQLERAKREWEVTFDAIEDPILILDTEMTIVRANKAAARLADEDVRNLPGRKCFSVVAGLEEPCDGCPVKGQPQEGLQREVQVKGNRCIVSVFPVREAPLEGRIVVHCKCLK